MTAPKVHILATCVDPAIIRATTLVFDTLHTGFPNAEVVLWLNDLSGNPKDAVLREASKANVNHVLEIKTIHHEWIDRLLKEESEPFWILDTDVVFWADFEDCDHFAKQENLAMFGRHIPQFFDSFTKCLTKPRLHTSLLYLDPARIKAGIAAWSKKFPVTPFNPWPNLVHPICVPSEDRWSLFFDTASMLFLALWESPEGENIEHFHESELDLYDHLNFGTISHIVAPHYPNEHFREQHFAILEKPSLLKDAWKKQDEFYRRHANPTAADL